MIPTINDRKRSNISYIAAALLLLSVTVMTCTEEPRISVYDSFDDVIEDPNPNLPDVEKLTTGPEYHWFGYYDKT
ncbi:MAG: hypothetical protein RI573_17035 [Balneolaceae bacterium]|nr:hypothetical protein [Balneolaceae bacterium]